MKKIVTKLEKRNYNKNIVQNMNTTLLGFPYLFDTFHFKWEIIIYLLRISR